MVNAKYQFELMKSGLSNVILRPVGYFYDIVKVFRPLSSVLFLYLVRRIIAIMLLKHQVL